MRTKPNPPSPEKPREERLNLILFDLQYVLHWERSGEGSGEGMARVELWPVLVLPAGSFRGRGRGTRTGAKCVGGCFASFPFCFFEWLRAWRGVALPVFEHLALGYNYVVNTSSSSPSSSSSQSSSVAAAVAVAATDSMCFGPKAFWITI